MHLFLIHLAIKTDPQMLPQLLSGGKHDIDVDDLRNNTRYTGGYSEGSRTVRLFWEVMSLHLFMNDHFSYFSVLVKMSLLTPRDLLYYIIF